MSLTRFLSNRVHESARKKRVALAAQWPTTTAEVNHWQILPAPEEHAIHTHHIEAAFHFKLNDDYYGGYLHSVPMSYRDAERLARGNPTVIIRYNPAKPDETAVLAQDNPPDNPSAGLPFAILPG
jgi:Protein of unknown function (DUF3592)